MTHHSTRISATLGHVTRTNRGFEIIEFQDHYHVPCSLQASSLALFEAPGTSAIWMGPNDASPKVLAAYASRVGVETTEQTGWVPYDKIPTEVSLNTRAHLDRAQVAALISHLQNWLDHGTFQINPASRAD